jgi:hypothetical protein
MASERLKPRKPPEFTVISPVMLPVVPPEPIVKVPPFMVLLPVWVLVPVRVKLPVEFLLKAPVPEITPG